MSKASLESKTSSTMWTVGNYTCIIHGSWAPERMCVKCKTHTGLQRLSTETNVKYLTDDANIDCMLKWDSGCNGLKNMFLKLISLAPFFESLPEDVFQIDFIIRERERERRGTLIGCFPYEPQSGTEPAICVCARIGIKPVTFCCTGGYSSQRSHLVRTI